jgi:hypothetical protein
MCHFDSLLRRARALALGTLVVAIAGCPETPDDEAPFPRDYERVWDEARAPCVLSHDHELRHVRVFANDLAFGPYTLANAAYPVGAILLKAEYNDDACTELLSYVVMEKLPAGSTPSDEHDWTWRRFDPERREIVDARMIPATCITCHEVHCEAPPYGWDYTCTPGAPEPPSTTR